MRQKLGSILAIAAMMGDLTEPILPKRKVIENGHTSWGRYHNAKVKRGRAKERRAKLARKINWN